EPANVSRTFWPGAVVPTVTGGPPGAMVAVASGGTTRRATVADPALAPAGARSRAYVPPAGSWTGSRKAPAPAKGVDASVVPSGRRMDRVPDGIVLQLSWAAMRSPAVPVNVSRTL